MKKVLVDHIIKNISKYYNYDDKKLLEIRYGIETIYLTITKTIVVIIISLLMGTIKELLYFMILYGLLRIVGFGLHAKKAWHCWVFSLTLFSLIPYLIKILAIDFTIKALFFSICIILLAIYAPADTEKRPLIHKKKRIIYKVLTLIISITYLILSYYASNLLSNALMFACIMQTLMVIPVSYKLLGLKYGNYKSYRKGGKT